MRASLSWNQVFPLIAGTQVLLAAKQMATFFGRRSVMTSVIATLSWSWCKLPATRFLSWALLCALLTLVINTQSLAQTTTLRVEYPGNLPDHQRDVLTKFTQRLQSVSGERIRANPVVTADSSSVAALNRLRMGASDIGLLPIPALAGYEPDFGVFDALFVFKDMDAIDRYQASEEGRRLLALPDRVGIVGLGFLHSGMVQLVSRKPIDQMDRLEGLKIALFGAKDSPVAKQFAGLGTTPISLPFAERKVALERGVADALELGWQELATFGVGSLSALSVLESNHRYRGFVLAINKNSLSKLPPDLQAQVLREANEATKEFNALARAADLAAKQTVVKAVAKSFRALSPTDYRLIYSASVEKVWTQLPRLQPAKVIGPALAISDVASAQKFFGTAPVRASAVPEASIYREASIVREASETAMPRPASRPPSPDANPPAKRLSSDAAWNAWIERDGREVSFLEPNLRFDAVLDLSRYAYRQSGSVLADFEIQGLLKNAFARGERSVRLTVRPILIGGPLASTTGSKSEDILVVQLDRMAQPSEEQARREAAVLVSLGSNDSTLPEAASKLGAGTVKFPLKSTGTAGCAQVVFSIWDENGQRPLDYVVQTVSVRLKDGPRPECETNMNVQGGFSGMSGMLSAKDAPQINGALHVMAYDDNGKEVSVAMFLDVAKYQAARADRTLADRGLFSWKLQTSMQKFVGDKGELLNLITSARKTGNYEEAAKELRQRLFPPSSTTDDDKQADSAFEALQAMASHSNKTPVVLVRANTAQNSPVYLPMAILAARGAKLLTTPPVVIHPLPRERYATPTTCIDRWSLGVPSRLDGANGQVAMSTYDKMERYDTMAKLQTYLAPPRDVADAAKAHASSQNARGEGLILLGHQDNGNIWFTTEPGAGRLIPEEYKRIFPPGSLAVLAACSAANPSGDNQMVLGLLNGLGIDVVIASPFPIEVTYAVALVHATVESAHEAYVAKKTPTVLELFRLATARAAKQLSSVAKLEEKALEFVILGDHTIRLCKD